MSKHTPGTWVAVRTPESYYFDWAVRTKGMSLGIDTRNAEADARLIAAAPDLLEALQALQANEFNHDREAAQLAVAAIAKATGEQA